MKIGQFCIKANRGQWEIFQCHSISKTVDGLPRIIFAPVSDEASYDYADRESALKRSYELNGWKWPPKPRPR